MKPRSWIEALKSDLEVHWYVVDHAFANPSGGRYDEEDARAVSAVRMSTYNSIMSVPLSGELT